MVFAKEKRLAWEVQGFPIGSCQLVKKEKKKNDKGSRAFK